MNRRPTARAVAALLPLALVAACGGSTESELEIGVRALSLALAFEDEELAVPVSPDVIVRLIPAPPDVTTGADLSRYQSPAPNQPVPTFPSLPTCAAAPEGATPRDLVAFAVDHPPEPGVYRRHNEGTLTITGGPFPLTLPYPPFSEWQVGPGGPGDPPEVPTAVPVPPTAPGFALPDAPSSDVPSTEYEITKVVVPGFSITDRYRLLPDRIQLVERRTDNNGAQDVIHPTPAIDVYVFGAEGTGWASAGVDLDHGTGVLFEGTIVHRELVDVCGEVFDTYRVEAQETYVNLATGATSGTFPDDPNLYDVSPTHGGLFLREDVHNTQTVTDPETGLPVTIELQYVSTVDSVTPTAAPAP
jgi:hypothetical protein